MNAIIYKTGTDSIAHFIKDAVRYSNRIIGSNGEVVSKSFSTGNFEVLWVDSEPTVILNTDNQIIGYKEKVSDFTANAEEGPTIKSVTDIEFKDALKKRKKLALSAIGDVGKEIEKLKDIEEIKAYLVELTEELRAHIKISDYHRQG